MANTTNALKTIIYRNPHIVTIPVTALLSVIGFKANDALLIAKSSMESAGTAETAFTLLGCFFGLAAILLMVFAVSELVCLAATLLRKPGADTPKMFWHTKNVILLAAGALLLAVADPLKAAFAPAGTTVRAIGNVITTGIAILFVIAGIALVLYSSIRFLLAICEHSKNR